MPKSKPTQREIARAVGVSQGLVSLVLNNADADVAESTRLRILETAKRLGYALKKPDLRVPTIRSGSADKRRVLAYIPRTVQREVPGLETVYDAYEEFYAQFQNHLVEAASKRGFSLLVRPCENPTDITSWLIEWGVDGVILHFNDQPLGEWIAHRFPMVQVSHRFVSNADAVMPNHAEIVTLAMEYLYKQGHRHIAHIAKRSQHATVQCRNQAYRDFATRHNLPIYEELLSYVSAEERASQLFERASPRPTAIIAGDPTAILLQREAVKRGLSIPQDLSVIGIDNTSIGRFVTPTLTSVDIQIEQITRTALSLISERLADPTRAFQKVEISPKLIVRESVTDPASSATFQTTPQTEL